MRELPFETCAPFDFDRLYGNEKYTLQNMLLKEVRMPSGAYRGEVVYDVWSDRSANAFWNNAKKIKSTLSADAFFAGADDKSFLEWASAVVSEVEGKPIKLDGAAVVRFTNAMSQYPVLRLTGIVMQYSTRHYGITERCRKHTISMNGYEVVEDYA